MRMDYKTCTNPKCRKKLPATNEFFHAKKDSSDGLSSNCKECRAVYYKDNCETIREHKKQLYWSDREKELEQKERCERLNIKICTKCEKELSATTEFFHRDGRLRFSLHSQCKECCSEYDKQYREQNVVWLGEYRKEYSKSFEGRKVRKKYCQSKKARVLSKRRYKENRLSRCMSSMVWFSLKGNKAGCSWETFVPYTLEELALHLQKTIGLTDKIYLSEFWQNFYGKYYHVDHKRPRASFDKEKLQDPNSEEFQKCWALENLQLLFAEENTSKGSNLDWVK